jgi:hypothetical protein
MKTILFPSFIAAVISFSACAGNDQQEETTGAATTSQPGTTPAASPATGGVDTTQKFPVVSQQPLPNLQPQGSASGLNPEHGKPNHRCDIAVGAPLSTPIGQNPPNMTQPAPAMPQLPAISPGGAKLNPAHGAPGHDCGIPVGQPLKS